jgi:tetratricopeptide (TPR) repeat protein
LQITEIIPTDSELWAELGEAYFTSGQFLQAIHAYQDVVLLTPHAYNVFARIAEIYHTLVVRNPNYNFVDKLEYLRLSVQHFLRAVELCPVYVRGWAGIQIVSQKILTLSESASKLQADDKKKYTELAEFAERKLLYIVSEKKATPENLAAANAILGEY